MTDTAKEAEKKGDLVFISYATPDRRIAGKIYSGLRARGIKVWKAPQDIDGGQNWPKEISNAISNSVIMIVVLSEDAQKSSYVNREVTLATNKNIIIIPFFIKDVSLSGDLEFLLSNQQRINAFRGSKKKHLDQLVKTVLAHLGKAPVTPVKNGEEQRIAAKEAKSKETKKTGKHLLQKIILIAVPIIILLTAAVFFKILSNNEEVETKEKTHWKIFKPIDTNDNTPPIPQYIKDTKPRAKNQEPINQGQTLKPDPDPPSISEINRQHAEVNPLKVSIICKRKEESTNFEISPQVVLYTGDHIWFEITLPELGGYLLVYAKDSHGKVFNLFPGTKKAIKEGNYRFPYHLENYSTEVLKVAREQSVDLPKNKLRIGGYTLDENTGSENIYFYYSNQRDKRLENYLKKFAVDVGKDITFKGFESTVEKYTPGDVNRSIKRPLLHYREIVLSLKHE